MILQAHRVPIRNNTCEHPHLQNDADYFHYKHFKIPIKHGCLHRDCRFQQESPIPCALAL